MVIIKTVSEALEASDFESKWLSQLREIFYESAAIKDFSSPEKKEAFYQRWCGIYLEQWPSYCLLAIEGEQLLGYLVGCPNSTEALKVLTMPGYDIFSEYFSDFPAHLHMNVHFSTRGRGIGQKLVDRYCQKLQEDKITGVFIITAAMSRPTLFYMKMGFNSSFTCDYGGSALLLMGKKL